MSTKYVAIQPATVSSGTSIGATSVTLSGITDRDGNTLSMSDFGTIGYGVISSKKSLEEQFTFTGISGNTVSGISHVTMKSPYTQTSGFTKAHSPGETVILYTNSPALYDTFANKTNTESITGKWTFTTGNRPTLTTDTDTTTNADLVTYGQLTRTSFAGVSNASTTAKGIVELPTQTEVDAGTPTGGTGASLSVTPDTLRAKKYHDYLVDSGTVNAIAITPSPAVIAYTAGDHYVVKVANTITSATPTLNVAGLGAKTIVKTNQSLPTPADIIAAGIYDFVYDGTNFQVGANTSNTFSATAGATITAGQPLHLTQYYQTDGGVTYDNGLAATQNNTTNPSVSFTVTSNANRLLIAMVGTAGNTPTSVTYNGVAMTLDKSLSSTGFWFVYKLIAPASGANTLTITCANVQSYNVASYYGVHQTTGIEASTIGSTGGSGATNSVTTLSSMAGVHGFGGVNFTGGSVPGSFTTTYVSKYSSANSSTTTATATGSAFTNANTIGFSCGKFNEPQTVTATVTHANSGADIGYICSIAPATSATAAVVPLNTTAVTNNPPLIDFVGFSGSSASANSSVSVITQGTVNGLSGLTAGALYYGTNTAGTISTTKGTYGKAVGKALTSTSLLIYTEPTIGSSISKSGTATLTAETNGFYTTSTTTLPISKGETYTGAISFRPLS